jgi:hypothetical protein
MVKIGDFTYLSATEVWFMSRRFPIETTRPDKYMKIKPNILGGLKTEDLYQILKPLLLY